jgi:hypothetical protein
VLSLNLLSREAKLLREVNSVDAESVFKKVFKSIRAVACDLLELSILHNLNAEGDSTQLHKPLRV